MLYTSRNAFIAFSIPGVSLDKKSWDRFQGGGHTSDTQNHTPGGMQPAIAIAGASKRNQATIERAYDDTLIGLEIQLDQAVGSPCSIGVTPLLTATTTAGTPRTYTGVVKEVNPPERDSTSSSIAMFQVVVELNEPITD